MTTAPLDRRPIDLLVVPDRGTDAAVVIDTAKTGVERLRTALNAAAGVPWRRDADMAYVHVGDEALVLAVPSAPYSDAPCLSLGSGRAMVRFTVRTDPTQEPSDVAADTLRILDLFADALDAGRFAGSGEPHAWFLGAAEIMRDHGDAQYIEAPTPWSGMTVEAYAGASLLHQMDTATENAITTAMPSMVDLYRLDDADGLWMRLDPILSSRLDVNDPVDGMRTLRTTAEIARRMAIVRADGPAEWDDPEWTLRR